VNIDKMSLIAEECGRREELTEGAKGKTEFGEKISKFKFYSFLLFNCFATHTTTK